LIPLLLRLLLQMLVQPMAKRGRKAKGPKTLEEKIRDADVSFVDEIRVATPDQIKDRLVKLDRYETELLDTKKNDMELQSLREKTKTANETYSVPLKAVKLKREFMLVVLTEKGQ
jgi:hypothetical protein